MRGTIAIRISNSERSEVEKASTAAGVPLTRYFREAALERAERELARRDALRALVASAVAAAAFRAKGENDG